MWLSTKISRLGISSFLIVSLSVLASADTLRLKDGSIIKGKIVSFGGGQFVVAMGEGSRRRELRFSAAEVESIKFEESGPAAASTRTASYKEPEKTAESQDKIVIESERAPVKPSGEKMKPIEWSIKVSADSTANGWTNTGWVVKKGQRIHISGDGRVSLGRNQTSPPSGLSSLDDDQKLLKNVPTGALIAVIGDDNNDFIYIGAEREFTATRDGSLFLGINEGNLEDNSGAYSVKVQIIPDGIE